MGAITALGSRYYIGGFGPLESEAAWVEITEVVNGGDLAEQFAKIEWNVLNPGETKYAKGAKGTTELALEMVYDPDDAGQADLESAANDPTPDRQYNMKIALGPDPVGGGTFAKAPESTFKATIFGFSKPMIGTTDNMIRATATIQPVTNSITYTAGVPGSGTPAAPPQKRNPKDV